MRNKIMFIIIRLEILHIQELAESDIYCWMKEKHEVEIVDMLLWIRDRYRAFYVAMDTRQV